MAKGRKYYKIEAIKIKKIGRNNKLTIGNIKKVKMIIELVSSISANIHLYSYDSIIYKDNI